MTNYKVGDRIRVDWSDDWRGIIEITEVREGYYYYTVIEGSFSDCKFGNDSSVSTKTSLLERQFMYEIY